MRRNVSGFIYAPSFEPWSLLFLATTLDCISLVYKDISKVLAALGCPTHLTVFNGILHIPCCPQISQKGLQLPYEIATDTPQSRPFRAHCISFIISEIPQCLSGTFQGATRGRPINNSFPNGLCHILWGWRQMSQIISSQRGMPDTPHSPRMVSYAH